MECSVLLLIWNGHRVEDVGKVGVAERRLVKHCAWWDLIQQGRRVSSASEERLSKGYATGIVTIVRVGKPVLLL